MSEVASLPAKLSAKVQLAPCPVDLPGDCWLWTGTINHKGYGHIYIDGSTRRAHRVSWELLVGPIEDGKHLDHLCRNRSCINPEHLEPVTNAVNAERSERATKELCLRGHPLSGANLIVKSANSKGRRQCRECKRLSRSGLLRKAAS